MLKKAIYSVGEPPKASRLNQLILTAGSLLVRLDARPRPAVGWYLLNLPINCHRIKIIAFGVAKINRVASRLANETIFFVFFRTSSGKRGAQSNGNHSYKFDKI